MKTIELLLDLVGSFTFRRWLSLVLIISTLAGTIWVIDFYTNFTQIYRIEKTIDFLERLNALKGVGGELSPEIQKAKNDILTELDEIRERKIPQKLMLQAGGPWLAQPWAKLISGGLPWFLLSFFALTGAKKNEQSAWPGFFAVQFFTIAFACLNYLIPSSGRPWIDHLILPWGILFVFIVIPVSIAAVSGFKRVRDSSTKKAITNNLKQLSSAADQFYLENGVNHVTYDQLVGPSKYIRSISPVDGELYDIIEFQQGEPLVVFRKNGDAVRYET